MKKIKLYIGYAGFCLAKENHAIRGGRRKDIKFKAVWSLIEHPTKGYVLFDTGYTRRFYNATNSFPSKIYALVTKVKVTAEDEVITQLQNAGIDPTDIKYIFISHFHADHDGGLLDFPSAKIICSKKAWDYTKSLSSLFSFSKGVLKDLIPKTLESRMVAIESLTKRSDYLFGDIYDLFDDQSILIYYLPGHARGQYGISVETAKKRYFLIADACWLKKSYEENILPQSIVRVFIDSWRDLKSTNLKVHQYYKANPEVQIVPTHCSETTDMLVKQKISLDEL